MAAMRMEITFGPGITVGQLEEEMGNLRKIGLRDSVITFRTGTSGDTGACTMKADRKSAAEVDDE